MIAFGAWAGRYGADVANDLATPWVGIIERISVYAYQLWFGAFASALLALAHGHAGSRWRTARAATA